MKNWLTALGSLIATLAATFFTGKKLGQDQEQNTQEKQVINDVEKSKAAADTDNALSDADVDKRLQKYVRK